MEVTVIGGGNVGSAMAARMSLINGVKVTLWTRRPERFKSRIRVIDRENGTEFGSKEIMVTADSGDAVRNADIVFCTVPSFARADCVSRMSAHLKKDVLLGFVPGSGGAEFICKKLLPPDTTIFALQRVPYTCRMLKEGECCAINSIKPVIYAASIPSAATASVRKLVEDLLRIPCVALDSFLEATLVPSNAILHTSRNYRLFKNYTQGTFYKNNPYFYLDWDDESSEILLSCDGELQNVCRLLGGLKGVVPLREHYESSTPEQLTNKLSTMPAFKRSSTLSPMVEQSPGKWVPDWESRYFIEDFPYGLAVIKGFANIVRAGVPTIDKVLGWYQKISGQEYFRANGQPGTHIKHCGAPQRYGYTAIGGVMCLYG